MFKSVEKQIDDIAEYMDNFEKKHRNQHPTNAANEEVLLNRIFNIFSEQNANSKLEVLFSFICYNSKKNNDPKIRKKKYPNRKLTKLRKFRWIFPYSKW